MHIYIAPQPSSTPPDVADKINACLTELSEVLDKHGMLAVMLVAHVRDHGERFVMDACAMISQPPTIGQALALVDKADEHLTRVCESLRGHAMHHARGGEPSDPKVLS